LVKKTGEHHRTVTSHWQTLSLNVSSTPRHERHTYWRWVSFCFKIPDVFRFKKTNSQKQYYWKIHLCLNCKPFMTVSLNDIGELWEAIGYKEK
jgi:hypothetical protein